MNAAEHPNATAYRKTADAFRARDFDAIRSLVAEDVVWHVPGRHSMAGEIRGLNELVAWLGRLDELGFTLREHDVFGNDVHVCALSHMGARRPRGRHRDSGDERLPLPRCAAGRAVDLPGRCRSLGGDLRRLTCPRGQSDQAKP